MRQETMKSFMIASILAVMPLFGMAMLLFGYESVRNGLSSAQPISELAFMSGIAVLIIWVLLVYAALFRMPNQAQKTKRRD